MKRLQREEPAGPRRPERGDPGEPGQLQGRSSPSTARTTSVGSSTTRTSATSRRRCASGAGQQRLLPVYGLAYNLAQLDRAAVRHQPDRRRPDDGRPADRLPAVRQQLLPAAAPAGDRVGLVPARAGGPRPDLGRAARSSRTCRMASRGGAGGRQDARRRRRVRSRRVQLSRRRRRAARVHVLARPRKTYALVGPTGGGKTTTASLMARLYDPTRGRVLLDGRDIRSYAAGGTRRRIGFILQEPFLFTGTVRDNIVYGNDGAIATLRRSKSLSCSRTGTSTICSRGSSRASTRR